MGFIRTGFLGTKVSLGKGAIVLPVFHEVTWVSLETLKLVVSRAREQAVLTSDKIRVDVVAELYTHVGHTTDDLLTAARSLGERTFDAERVRNLSRSEGGERAPELCGDQDPGRAAREPRRVRAARSAPT